MKLSSLLSEDRKYTSINGEIPHKHTYWIFSDEGGDGRTTSTSDGPKHAHAIRKCEVLNVGWEGGEKDLKDDYVRSHPKTKLDHTHKIDCDPTRQSDATKGRGGYPDL